MGCGGSKDEVAAGNTVSTKSLQREEPDTTTKNFEKPENSNGQKEDIKNVPVAADHETTVGDTDFKEAVVGRMISKESPDLYFSSRKEETPVAAVHPPEVKAAVAVKEEEEAPPPNAAALSPIDKEKSEAEDLEDSKEKEAASIEVNDSDPTVEEKKN